MKNVLKLSALALGCLAIVSCSKSKNDNPYFVKATIDGVAFNGSYAEESGSNGAFSIVGSPYEGSTRPVVLITMNSLQTGTFSLDQYDSTHPKPAPQFYGYGAIENAPNASTTGNAATAIFFASTGKLVITEVTSSSVSGTFEFSYTGGRQVTNGSFKAKRNN